MNEPDPRAAETPAASPLPLHGGEFCCCFPPYGYEFWDMAPLIEAWQENLPDPHHFWPGIAGGGVLAVPKRGCELNNLIGRLQASCRWFPFDSPYGMVLGNEAGKEFDEWILRALPDRPPWWAIWLGLARYIPEMSVGVTAEHLDGLGDRRYLLVVPRAGYRRLKQIDRLPEWFGHFGVSVGPPEIPSPAFREQVRDWFDDPDRRTFLLPLSGGEPNAAWQLAVVCHVAQHWETQARGLQDVHFVASIEGKPNVRKNWTSNR